MNADSLRLIFVAFLLAMYLVAGFYLSRRKMPKLGYVFWGFFALMLPAFGPFFLIAYRPGELVRRERNGLKSGLRGRQDKYRWLYRLWREEIPKGEESHRLSSD